MRRGLLLVAVAFVAQCATAEAGFAPENDLVGTGPFPEASAIATDPQGDSLIAWSVDPEGAEPVLARWLSASGQLGPTLDLFPGGRGFEPQMGMAPSGRAFVAWRSTTNTESTIYGRWVEPDGSLGPLLTLATPDPGKFSAGGSPRRH